MTILPSTLISEKIDDWKKNWNIYALVYGRKKCPLNRYVKVLKEQYFQKKTLSKKNGFDSSIHFM